MEQEICRKESTKKITTIFKFVAYAFGALGAFGLLAVVMAASTNNAWDYLFSDSSYYIAIIITIIFAILSVVFYIIDKNVGKVTSYLVLTNKRIYHQVETSKIKQIESYNLNAITYYSLYQTIIIKKTYCTLTFKTSTATAKFIVDNGFYNEFVNAVNSTTL